MSLSGLIEVKWYQLNYHTGSYRPSAILFYTFLSINTSGNLPSFQKPVLLIEFALEVNLTSFVISS